MDFTAGFLPGSEDAGVVARRLEEQGWYAIGVGDHLYPNGQPYGHMASMLGYLAGVTSRIRLASTYGNTLLRSPVEYAHMALTLQQVSGGRFEAGLGAGWAEAELHAMGLDFPANAERASRFREAATIVSALLRSGSLAHSGQHYQADVVDMGVPVDQPPPFGVSVAGPWTARHVSSVADWVEIAPFGAALRSGHMNLGDWQLGGRQDVQDLVDIVREVNPTARLSIGCFVAAGSGPAVERVKRVFGDGPLAGMAGSASEVADTLQSYGAMGFDGAMLGEFTPGTLDALAPLLI